MPSQQTLEELARQTDSLTYLNAIKVTLTQIKTEIATQEDLRSYQNESAERVKKFTKRLDNQYRLFAKLVNKEAPLASGITIEDDTSEESDQLKEIMEDA